MIYPVSKCWDDVRSLFHSVVIVSQSDEGHCIVAYRGILYQAVWDAKKEQYILQKISWKR